MLYHFNGWGSVYEEYIEYSWSLIHIAGIAHSTGQNTDESWINSQHRNKIFLLSQSEQISAVGLTQPPVAGSWALPQEKSGWAMNLTTNLQVIPKFGMIGGVTLSFIRLHGMHRKKFALLYFDLMACMQGLSPLTLWRRNLLLNFSTPCI